MNYARHYKMLINRALVRGQKKPDKLDINYIYFERHHIVPKCMGGEDIEDNLVLLTPEEHYLAHQLLCKIYPDNHSLLYAINMMCIGDYRNNKRYGWVRRRLSNYLSELNSKPKSEEFKTNISNTLKGRTHTKRHHDRIINTKREHGNLNQTDKTKFKISKTMSILKWFNNGIMNVRSNACPDGYVCGRLPFSRKTPELHEKSKINTSSLQKFNSFSTHGNQGRKNNSWIGFYITPAGIFESSIDAALHYNVSDKTIRDRCRSTNLKFIDWKCIKVLDNE